MSTIFYKDNPYGGTTTVTDAGHVLVTQGSDTVTAQAKFNTQTTAIQRILGNFATVEESTTASKAYNVGDYLVLNSFLYKVTYPIAAGGTIDNTQNGNVTKTTAGKEFGNGGGGGGSSVMELTQAQYDALSEEEKMDDIIYLIKDSPDNYLDEVFGDFASVEYTNTASKAYAIGDYLVYDNKFYKVTAAISQGDTITVGTNITQTNVGDELDNLNSNKADKNVSGIGYCKMPDGTLMVFGQSTIYPSSTSGTQRGSLYQYVCNTNIPFSPSFISVPYVSISKLSGNSGAIAWTKYSMAAITEVDIWSPDSSIQNASFDIIWFAIGRWK